MWSRHLDFNALGGATYCWMLWNTSIPNIQQYMVKIMSLKISLFMIWSSRLGKTELRPFDWYEVHFVCSCVTCKGKEQYVIVTMFSLIKHVAILMFQWTRAVELSLFFVPLAHTKHNSCYKYNKRILNTCPNWGETFFVTLTSTISFTFFRLVGDYT